MLKEFNYGSTIINSDVKLKFDSRLSKYRVEGEFKVELKIYCGRKKMYFAEDIYQDVTIGYAIKNVFKNKIEEKVTFHKGHNYFAEFSIYKLTPIKRPKYVKTDTYIDTSRRKYLLRERINISF